MKKDVKLLTKVAKGVAFGDVSNVSVRNILTEISKKIGGRITEQDMHDALDYFDWKCPYTGRDLRESIENHDGSYVTDHIYPQNKESCGLNVKGNLVIVDKKANSAKGSDDIESFLLKNTKFFGDLDAETRKDRLAKIKAFQSECGYDPERVRDAVSSLMQRRYAEAKEAQEKWIADSMASLEGIGIHAISTPAPKSVSTSAKARKNQPELVFFPTDEARFKEELLTKKKAYFVLTYDDGAVKTSPWRADTFSVDSNLRANIQSRPFWRNKAKEGLVKVEVHID